MSVNGLAMCPLRFAGDRYRVNSVCHLTIAGIDPSTHVTLESISGSDKGWLDFMHSLCCLS